MFSSFDNFGLTYKTGSEKTLLRLSLLFLDLQHDNQYGRQEDSIDSKYQSYGAGFRVGFERRAPVFAKLDFIWGIEAGCNYNYQQQKRNESHYSYYYNYEMVNWSVTPLVCVVLGVRYTILDHLVLGAEISPGIMYSFGKVKTTNSNSTVEETVSSVRFNLSNGTAGLTVAYRFGK